VRVVTSRVRLGTKLASWTLSHAEGDGHSSVRVSFMELVNCGAATGQGGKLLENMGSKSAVNTATSK
jgi:hypothetical protein